MPKKKETAPKKGPSKSKTSAKTSAKTSEEVTKKPEIVEPKPRKTSAKKEEPYPIPVEPPVAPLKETQVLKEKPERPHTRKPDPWPDLSEKVRSYLKLWPYGTNLIVDRRRIQRLQNFFVAIRELPLPDTLWKELNKFQNEVRDLIELISIDDLEEQNKARTKEHWEPFNPTYNCKCHSRKRRAPKAKKLISNDDD